MDTFSSKKRSDIMRQVRSANTRPEKIVGSLLHRMGFRFRKHRKDLPGTPDFVLPKYRITIFVHGCFWHRHPGCPHADLPMTRQEYWVPKFKRTVERDGTNQQNLRKLGWNVIVIWECAIRDAAQLEKRLRNLISLRYDCHKNTEHFIMMAAEDKNEYKRT